jgi:hypothetical protein
VELRSILQQVAEGSLGVEEAERLIVEVQRESGDWKHQFLVHAASRRGRFGLFMPVIFAGLGTVFAVIGAVDGWRSWDFSRRGIETDGVVVRRVFAGGAHADESASVVRYKVEHNSYEFQGRNSFTPAIGQAVRVVYLPDRPSEGQLVSFQERWMRPLMFGLIGTLFTILGIVMLTSSRMARADRDD